MKKAFQVVIFLFMLFNYLNAQSGDLIVPFSNNGQWGFMNQAKEIVICPQFDEAYPPFNGLARFKHNDKYGFVNMQGEIQIKARFDHADDFRYGVARVFKGQKKSYIKTNGRKNKVSIGVCGTHYSCVYPMINRSAIIEENGKLGIVFDKIVRDENHHLKHVPDTIPPMFDSIIPISHQLMYIVKDSLISFAFEGRFSGGSKHVLENLSFDFEEIKLFNCIMCQTGKNEYIGFKQNGLWGYKRIYNMPKDFIPAKYYSISSLAKGFALVEYEKGRFGYIDKNGSEYFFR
ncbi:MAG: WG repeat-containing protein [Bacteroidetes bacterium]|nr:MAG: WG repeat-containing protein [Bacteroidota bacterium]